MSNAELKLKRCEKLLEKWEDKIDIDPGDGFTINASDCLFDLREALEDEQ